jgi:hypothetical protein
MDTTASVRAVEESSNRHEIGLRVDGISQPICGGVATDAPEQIGFVQVVCPTSAPDENSKLHEVDVTTAPQRRLLARQISVPSQQIQVIGG